MRILLRISMLATALFSSALMGCGGASGTSSTGTDSVSGQSLTVPRVSAVSPTERMVYAPDTVTGASTSAPPLTSDWTSISYLVNGVPCFGCVGSPPNNAALGIPIPNDNLALGNSYEVTYTWTNNGIPNTTSCTINFSIKQASTVLYHHTVSLHLNGNGTYAYGATFALPTATVGAATNQTSIKCGTAASTPAVQTFYLH